MLTVLEIIKKTTDFFSDRGIEAPRLNAELLIGHALRLPRVQLYLQFERPLAEAELDLIRPLVRRRSRHEPLQYILGETEFCGLQLKVDPRVLIPRPETERLVEVVVASCVRPPVNILDLGTGSGAIALALAQAFPAAALVAADIDPAALALARENAGSNALADRIQWVQSDWFATLPVGRFELIVANPPYLSADETAAAPLEVRGFEPTRALTAADGGLADLRTILGAARQFLSAEGLLALETGCNHHAKLLAMLPAAGFARGESRQDLAGRDRFLLAWAG